MRRVREKSTAAPSANAIRPKMLHRQNKPSSSACATVRDSGCDDEEPVDSAPVTRSSKIRFRESSDKGIATAEGEPPAKKSTHQKSNVATSEEAVAEVVDDEDKENLMAVLALYKELPDGSFACQLCQDVEVSCVLKNKPRVVRHIITQHGFSDAYECPSCSSSFRRESSLADHRDALHKSEKLERYVDCARCSHRSKDEALLRLHVLRKHAAAYRHVCGCCGRCFRTSVARDEHEKLTGCKKSKPKFECDKCEVVAKTKEDLANHAKEVHSRCFYRMIHTYRKLQYKCLICRGVFASKKAFHEHTPCKNGPAEGNEVDGFLCSECGKRLSSKDHLKKHARVHSGERPYACPECGQAFALRNTMRIHALSHCGIKPYICDICRFNYSQRSALMIHWKSKHKGLPPPPPVQIHQYFDADGRLLSIFAREADKMRA